MRRWSSTCVRAASSSAHTTPTRCLHKRAYSPPAAATATAPTTGSHPPPLLTTKPSHTQTPLASSPKVDPYALVGPELDHLRTTLLRLVGSAHPTLGSVAEYYFLHPSKQVRPLIVLLMARATNGLGSRWEEKAWLADVEGASGTAAELDRPLTRPDVLNDVNPNMNDDTLSFSSVFPLRPPQFRPPSPVPPPHILSPTAAPSLASLGRALPSQVRLAQIVEMIHVASLLHDDVIDVSDLRRGQPSAPAKFGPKLSVLGGDFLLGRASAALARLGEHEVTELIAAVIANLVEGEIMQLGREEARPADPALNLGPSRSVASENWNVYLRKTYLKTATLMAKGARAATVLGGTTEGQLWKELAYAYGRNIGIAFQLVDDVLDYEAGEATLGKPGGADLNLGLATGPALAAWEEHPEMGPLIARKFKEPGDVEMARDMVRRSSGVQRTRDLAQAHADQAREVLRALPDSDAKFALDSLAEKVMKRSH